MSEESSSCPLQVVLQAERALASIETDVRRAGPKTLHKCFEALADAYTYRPAGHRLDNLDRALLSYQSAVHLSSLTPSLSAKLANVCFLRSQTISRDRFTSPSLLRQQLKAARQYIDTAVRDFERDPALYLQPDTSSAYAEALLCRALVYDTLYQTIDTIADDDKFEQNSGSARAAGAERRRKRKHYISDCIESLEKVLAVDKSLAEKNCQNKMPQVEENTVIHENIEPHSTLHGVKKARAVMCLARAYSNVENARAKGVSEAIRLLGSVDEILDGVEDDDKLPEAVVSLDELRQMKEDAQAQRAALEASKGTTENRCVVS